MKRRTFLLASASTAGAMIPWLGRAAAPCPPPEVSAGGGTTASTPCGSGVPAGSYTTNFPLTENPISEGGRWTNAGAVGLDWNNVQSAPGRAFGAAIVSGYNDDIAVLNTGFAANQYAQGTVHRVGGYSPGVSHEIELLLRFQITAHNARGYEVLWGVDGQFAIVRWNGPLGDYTPLLDNVNIGQAVDGDVLRAEISGSTITVYKNGSQVGTVSNSTYTYGQPGIGFWPKSGAILQNYGWKTFEAGSL